jgi:hypothetical protein
MVRADDFIETVFHRGSACILTKGFPETSTEIMQWKDRSDEPLV